LEISTRSSYISIITDTPEQLGDAIRKFKADVEASGGKIEIEKLMAKLRELKTQQPDQSAITLSTEDAVKYEDLVRLIDTVVQDGTNPLFPSVSVSPASAT
jgi:hypothetical protein